MSATVERLLEIEEAGAAPAPWPIEFFYDVPPESFAFLFSLVQAWPLLRAEVEGLEAALEVRDKAAREWTTERAVLVERFELVSTALNNTQAERTRENLEALENLERAKRELEALRARVSDLEEAAVVAMRVCASIGPPGRAGHRAHGTFDGAALDEWRRLTA